MEIYAIVKPLLPLVEDVRDAPIFRLHLISADESYKVKIVPDAEFILCF
ncbi:hypothetical protein PITCH_A1100026 [uncultured Desulfobacterium sp.]|uniref:Uncharacterized protein n=1 Tax=uncultured Desulfobacterium sp. TaxID=201089 RepID=A0A445MR39_9BACT|nr:hypothetical protein PITCH_A1100026 [uncultured Desulfobacterium sp.]